MSGKIIKILTNIRFRRSVTTSRQSKNELRLDDSYMEFEERAAIIEYMGNMPRPEAETLARKCLSRASINHPERDAVVKITDNKPTNGEFLGVFYMPK